MKSVRKKICTAVLHSVPVTIYVRDGCGAEFDMGNARYMEIGLEGSWWAVLERYLHEVMEISMCLCRCRFTHANERESSDRYVFQMDHNQFSRVCEVAAEFIAETLPKLAAAYKKQKSLLAG